MHRVKGKHGLQYTISVLISNKTTGFFQNVFINLFACIRAQGVKNSEIYNSRAD